MPDADLDLEDVVAQLRHRSEDLPETLAHRRPFVETYARTTVAIDEEADAAGFEDPTWVRAWGTTFAGYFVRAHDADRAGAAVTRPWRLAFDAPATLHPLVHLLLGLNAHINFDLPQAMLDVLPATDLADPVLRARRQRDHERIDAVLGSRVSVEDGHLEGPRRRRDRLLTPANRLASRRFLRESRRSVWHNVLALHEAREEGPEAYAARVAELEVLCAARLADLLEPGQVLLRFAVKGFGVRLPPPEVRPGALGQDEARGADGRSPSERHL